MMKLFVEFLLLLSAKVAGGTDQDWFSGPVLPLDLADDPPPLLFLSRYQAQAAPPQDHDRSREETDALRGVTAADIQAWRQQDDLHRIRETFSDLFFGVPALVPQLVIESLVPKGIPIGPTTYLYRTSPAGSSFALVLFDQVLFHEAQFAEWARTEVDSGATANLRDGQRHALRKAFMTGLRATYALPPMTLAMVAEAADEEGVLGYAAAPAIAAAILYMQGIDQKVRVLDDVTARVKFASGRQWIRGLRAHDGLPTLSVEVHFCNFPVGLVVTCDASSRGLNPSFVGIGTSLDVVEDVLGLEASRTHGERPR